MRADVRAVNRAQSPEYLHLLVPNIIGVKRRWRLHRTEGEHLKKMVLSDIPHHPGRVVEPAAFFDADRLRGVYLHVVDVLAVPERLENRVSEAEHENVLDRLLAEIVIDPEGLAFVQIRGQELVERLRRR